MHAEALIAPHFLQSPSYKALASVAMVLERFVARAPRGCHSTQMTQDTNLSRRDVEAICSALRELHVISFDADEIAWVLCRHPGEITLQDAWEAALLVDLFKRRNKTDADECAGDREIDLLIQQAALAISQSVAAQLKRFQLDRVNTSKWGFLSMP